MHVNTINAVIVKVNMLKSEVVQLRDRDDIQFECPEGVEQLQEVLASFEAFKDYVKACRHE